MEIGLRDVDLSWQWEPLVLGSALLLLILFAQAFIRLRRRGRHDLAGWGRVPLFLLGLGLGTCALVSPLDAIGEEYLISAHMLQHLLIGDIAPALVLVAVRGPLLFFLVPPFALRRLAHIVPLRRALAWLLRPAVSFGIWALALGLWHVPAAYDSVLSHQWAHDLEHLSFIVGGTLVWAQLIDPARRHELSRNERVGFAIGVFAGGQVLAYAMALSTSAFYPAYANQPERLFGLSALTDQKLAGVLMMVEQAAALGIFAWFAFGRAARKASAARRLPRSYAP
jgi:putative membrane protein